MEEGQEEKEEQRGTGQRKERKGQGEKRKARLQQTNKETHKQTKGGGLIGGIRVKVVYSGLAEVHAVAACLSGDLKRAVHCFLLSTAYFFASMVLHMFMAFVFACFYTCFSFSCSFCLFLAVFVCTLCRLLGALFVVIRRPSKRDKAKGSNTR